MTEREESMKYYHSRESENDEYKKPSVAMMSIVLNQPHPVCITKLFFMQKTQILKQLARENRLILNKIRDLCQLINQNVYKQQKKNLAERNLKNKMEKFEKQEAHQVQQKQMNKSQIKVQ
ncbi:unnamed protein product [Paramecium sonneborni]|uniref:Uncharacterized protein n=1 Tax=Paramecium sonneborni TaxID=65129 RepID=A0A8S1JT57_9CILI|nr:unnamed protein product [Paramecium sonneborni]